MLGVRLLSFGIQGARPAGRAPALLLAGLLLAACGAAGGSSGGSGGPPGSQPPSSTPVPAPSATAPAVLTEADSGRTYRVVRGSEPNLRLSGQYVWTPPAASGPATLHPIMFFRDPGYSEWTISIDGDAPVTIRSEGSPNCPRGTTCSRPALAFTVTLVPG